MLDFAIFLKSYRADYEQAKKLVDSFVRFNCDKLTIFICVPYSDIDLFSKLKVSTEVVLISDEEVCQDLTVVGYNGITPGYINQQVIKLSFWKKNLAANYFCIDSDSYFIRDFYFSDFMADKDTPYSVLVQDKDMATCAEYYRDYWQGREVLIHKIAYTLGYEASIIRTCHGHTTLSAKVLRSLEDDFMKSRGLTYLDLIKIVPMEFTWYNIWMQKTKLIRIEPIEPLFKVFHIQRHYLNSLKCGLREADIARSYIGIVMNSGWVRYLPSERRVISFGKDPNLVFGLFKKFAKKVKRKVLKLKNQLVKGHLD